MSIDFLSLTTVYIELLAANHSGGKPLTLGHASGFVIERNRQKYIITNWHVVTGKDSITKQPLDKSAALPTKAVIKLISHCSGSEIRWKDWEIDLTTSAWQQHPQGPAVDIVAISLPDAEPSNFQVHALNLSLRDTDVVCRPAMPVSIIGYPCGLTGGGYLPIWLTGYIASEPDIDINDSPLFYVNATGRGGLSGAPVVLRTSGGYTTSGGMQIMAGGVVTKFIGIYSGRAHPDSEVCRVWKATVLDDFSW